MEKTGFAPTARRLVIMAAIAAASTGVSHAGGTEGIEPAHHRLVLPKIARITLLENPRGKFMEGLSEPPQKCADVFVLTEKQVRQFFSRTDRVSQHDYFEVLPLSPCSVTGTVDFVNGDKARWSINSFQNGTIFFEDGKKNLFLYCPRCTEKPFNL